jgi:hypothetical protein
MQYLDRCMLSDLPSFKLTVPHLGQDNMVRNNNMPNFWNSDYIGQWRSSMSHKSSNSRMGEPVQAIGVKHQKQLLLIMVGIDIILSFGKQNVKLVWEFKGTPGQENQDF